MRNITYSVYVPWVSERYVEDAQTKHCRIIKILLFKWVDLGFNLHLFTELSQLEDLNTNRITRILTTDFPQYFAIVSRIRQEVHAIGPEGKIVFLTISMKSHLWGIF